MNGVGRSHVAEDARVIYCHEFIVSSDSTKQVSALGYGSKEGKTMVSWNGLESFAEEAGIEALWIRKLKSSRHSKAWKLG